MKYRISDFERLTGVPSATLRYYDSIGVLCTQRDQKNNYRSYASQDILRLIQLRQMTAFGIPLSSMPSREGNVACEDMLASLTQRKHEIEAQIENLHNMLGRIRLHENAFAQACEGGDAVKPARMVGTYRLFLSDPEVAAHQNTAGIFQHWMTCAPHVYSVVRVRMKDVGQMEDGCCPADIGIGLFKNHFDAISDTYREPMQYSAVTSCLQMMIETPDPMRIPFAALEPFFAYITQHNLIPLDDFYGWIVYSPVGEENPMYRISMRIAVGGL